MPESSPCSLLMLWLLRSSCSFNPVLSLSDALPSVSYLLRPWISRAFRPQMHIVDQAGQREQRRLK